VAEWFRDDTGVDTMPFIDNIFRFTQAGSGETLDVFEFLRWVSRHGQPRNI